MELFNSILKLSAVRKVRVGQKSVIRYNSISSSYLRTVE